jgi:hypothetical protein
MGIHIKPVQSTVVKDKKIIREIIDQIRKEPTARDIKRLEEGQRLLQAYMTR